jgi:hypothetical protein
MIEKRELSGLKPFEYIKERLLWGSKVLSGSVAKIDLEKGKVYALVPAGISEDHLYSFEQGGLYYSEIKEINNTRIQSVVNNSKELFQELIFNHIASASGNCCVFEEPDGSPSDPWVSKLNAEYIHYNEEMYYFFNTSNIAREKIEQATNYADGYYFLCVLSSLDNELSEFKSGDEISFDSLKTIADNCQTFFVGAYDGEGYLMWSKS